MTTENQSIFNAQATPDTTNTATPPAVSPSTTPNLPPEVLEFVGAGKKYSTVDDAIKSVPHAQNHIKSLTEELAKAKQELESRRTTESLLEELKRTGIPNTETPSVKGLTPEEVQKLVVQTLTQTEAEAKAKQNVSSVINNFASKFGTNAEAEYIKLAQESGLSVKELNQLSASSPSAVLKLAGLTGKQEQTVVSKPTSTVNTQTFNSNVSQQELSARVKSGASTKDLVSAWKTAGQKVGKV